MIYTGYIGTYSSPRSHGVYRFALNGDTGALSAPELFHEGRDMKFVALAGDTLAAPIQREDRGGVVLLDGEGRVLGGSAEEKGTSCYLLAEDDYLFSANFHEGLALVYRRRGGALELLRRISFGEAAGCHQILRYGRLMLVPCMNLDRVALLDAERDFAEVGAIAFAQGSGPRHGVFDRGGRYLYFATQMSHEVHVFRAEGERFRREAACPIFEGGVRPAGAETAAVRLSPDGRFLYVSTRGANVLTAFAVEGGSLSRIQRVSCGGDHPRDFILSPNGRFLLALNRDSNNLVSFPLDPETGLIGAAVAETEIWKGSGLILTGTDSKSVRS